MTQKRKNSISLFKGDNKILDNMEFIRNNTETHEWWYSPECGRGFYTAKDSKTAEFYAKQIAAKNGGEAIVNVYMLDLESIHKYVKTAYFNELNKRSLEYVGGNITNQLPLTCPNRSTGLFPVDLCYWCNEYGCEWNADYIEAILSYGEYRLDYILVDLINNKIDDNTAISLINAELKANDSDIKIQAVLKNKAFDYLTFERSYKCKV